MYTREFMRWLWPASLAVPLTGASVPIKQITDNKPIKISPDDNNNSTVK